MSPKEKSKSDSQQQCSRKEKEIGVFWYYGIRTAIIAAFWITVLALVCAIAVDICKMCGCLWWDACELLLAPKNLVKAGYGSKQDLIPIAVVIWTFATTVFLFFMGRVNERTYGLRLFALLNAVTRQVVNVGLVAAIFLEPIGLIVSLVIELKSLFLVIVFLQGVNALIVGAWTLVGQSRTVVQQIIMHQVNVYNKRCEEEIPAQLLISEMADGLDYDDEEEMDVFLLALRNIVPGVAQRVGREIGAKIACSICKPHSKFSQENLYNIFYKLNQLDISFQKGILTYLATERPFTNQKLCRELFRRAERRGIARKNKLLVWYIFQLNKEWDGYCTIDADEMYVRYYECEKEALSLLQTYVGLDDELRSLFLQFVDEIATDEKLDKENKKKLWKRYFVVMWRIRAIVEKSKGEGRGEWMSEF